MLLLLLLPLPLPLPLPPPSLLPLPSEANVEEEEEEEEEEGEEAARRRVERRTIKQSSSPASARQRAFHAPAASSVSRPCSRCSQWRCTPGEARPHSWRSRRRMRSMRTLAITLEELAPAALTPVDVTASSLPPSLNEFWPPRRSLPPPARPSPAPSRPPTLVLRWRALTSRLPSRAHASAAAEKAKSNRPSSERAAAAGTARALQHTLSSASHTPSSMRLGSLARRQKRSPK